MKNKYNAFKWWRELKPFIRKSLVNKYYPTSEFFVIDVNIDRIKEMYLKEKIKENGTILCPKNKIKGK